MLIEERWPGDDRLRPVRHARETLGDQGSRRFEDRFKKIDRPNRAGAPARGMSVGLIGDGLRGQIRTGSPAPLIGRGRGVATDVGQWEIEFPLVAGPREGPASQYACMMGR